MAHERGKPGNFKPIEAGETQTDHGTRVYGRWCRKKIKIVDIGRKSKFTPPLWLLNRMFITLDLLKIVKEIGGPKKRLIRGDKRVKLKNINKI